MASDRQHGGTLVARSLESLGVRHVFGLCGDHVNPIFDALADSSVRLIDFRDERGAGFAAEGWSLATGKPGVACVTAGPGVANVMGPLSDCHAWGVPVVVIAGRAPLREADRGHPGEMPQLEMVRPVTKWARTVLATERIPEYLARAFSEATSGRPGPAYVEIPIDVQARAAEAIPILAGARRSRPAPDPAAVAEAAEIVNRAERPLLVGGSGLWWSQAGEELRRFAERAECPVLLKGAARGLLPEDHDLSFGLPNPLFGAASIAMGQADAYVVAGTRLDLHLAHGGFIAQRPFVHIDVDPATGSLVADAAEALGALAEVCSGSHQEWIATLQSARRDFVKTLEERASSKAADGIHPAHLAGELRRLASSGTTICVDAGELGLYAFEMLPALAPGSLLVGINSPLGGLGPGVPFAIASALAHPARRTILLSGDGSLGFGAMELSTAARLGLPIDVVVGNDREWGIIAHMQDLLYGRRTATSLGEVDYAGLASALGCDGIRVDDADALAQALSQAARGRPRLVDVRLDREVMHPLCNVIAPMFAEH